MNRVNNSNISNIICKPLILFLIFEAALITYHLTQLEMKLAGVNLLLTIFGSALIYLLCAGGFEIAAWLLLAIVPFFFIALIAFLIISQVVQTHTYNEPLPDETQEMCTTGTCTSNDIDDSN